MAIATVWMGLLAMAFASGVTRRPVARKTTIPLTSPTSHDSEHRFDVGVRYGFAGGGRACFRPPAESSDGVVERGWVVGVAVISATVSRDGVDE